MKKLEFPITINASKEKVWDALWTDANYRSWTHVFSEGSYAVSDWEEGSKIQFLSGTGEGMVSRIVKKTPNEYMAFEHLGVIKDGEELPETEETKSWSGALETYTLNEKDGGTELMATVDISESHEKYFAETFPKAMVKVKEIAEG